MKVSYNRHYFQHAEGHIFLDKSGPCTIKLIGASSMTQAELDFFAEKMVKAIKSADLKYAEKNFKRRIEMEVFDVLPASPT